MDYQGLAIFIAAVGGFLTVVVSLVLQVLSFRQQSKIALAGLARDAKIEEMHKSINGQSEKLNIAIAGENFATGKEAGITQERANPQQAKQPTKSGAPRQVRSRSSPTR